MAGASVSDYFGVISKELCQFRELNFLCDTVLSTSDGVLHGHSPLLAASSPVFKTALEAAHTVLGSPHCICVPYLDNATLEIILGYIYTGCLTIPLGFDSVEQQSLLQQGLNGLGLNASVLDNSQSALESDGITENMPETEEGGDNAESIAFSCVSVDNHQSDDPVHARIHDVTQTPIKKGRKNKQMQCVENKTDDHIYSRAVASSEDDVNSLKNGDVKKSRGAISNATKSRVRKKLKRKQENKSNSVGVKCEASEPDCMLSTEIDLLLEACHDMSHAVTANEVDHLDSNSVSNSVNTHGSFFNSSVREDVLFSDMDYVTEIKSEESDESTAQEDVIAKADRAVPRFEFNGVHYTCLYCTFRSKYKCNVTKHIKTHSKYTPLMVQFLSCLLCSESFKSKYLLACHLRTHMEQRSSVSEDPVTDSSDAKPVRKKTGRVSKNKSRVLKAPGSYKCPVCDRKFTKLENMKRHSLMHSDIKPHLCELCGRGFTRKDFLMDHVASHSTTGDNLHTCPQCSVTFMRRISLIRHCLNVHGFRENADEDENSSPKSQRSRILADASKAKICETCGKIFLTLSALTNHRRIHKLAGQLTCAICDKSYTSVLNLRLHERAAHSKEHRYTCTVCAHTFAKRAQLNTHMVRHSDIVQKIKCTTCSKTFPSEELLDVHMKYHTEEKPFKCSFCARTFRSRDILNNHVRTHTGEKPFECSRCDKTFRQSVHLRRHMVGHTGEKLYSCEMCSKAYTSRTDLRYHYKRVHLVEPT